VWTARVGPRCCLGGREGEGRGGGGGGRGRGGGRGGAHPRRHRAGGAGHRPRAGDYPFYRWLPLLWGRPVGWSSGVWFRRAGGRGGGGEGGGLGVRAWQRRQCVLWPGLVFHQPPTYQPANQPTNQIPPNRRRQRPHVDVHLDVLEEAAETPRHPEAPPPPLPVPPHPQCADIGLH
jgi:hypothetical protein